MTVPGKRFYLLPSYSGNTNAFLGVGVYDADVFGTGIPSFVEISPNEDEARAFVAERQGVIVELPHVPGETVSDAPVAGDAPASGQMSLL